MAENVSDILMMVVNKGRALSAESRTQFKVDKMVDSLRAGFEPGQFCELMEFQVGAEPVEPKAVTFTRALDSSSIQLTQALTGCDTLDSVSIVKRRAAGTSNSGEIYLRLDFKNVLITGLSWDDTEERVEERGTFIYREITVRYRPQKPDGSHGTIIPANWKTPATSAKKT
jgi:type VI protein secretion system component Hcp